ncbi:MAG TPA: alpha/beta hydrolase domain-containing protein, partial [Acidimicrobiales bacterium]|nr:alpha/beta hydrolase domain-containing protein [Acidimicrobiales bacterium]
GIVDCPAPINAGSHTYELRAAVQAVDRWVTTGVAPRQSPRLQVDEATHTFKVDANGNALGGIRTPQVQAPVATLSGIGQPGATPAPDAGSQTESSAVSGPALCGIFGTTKPFTLVKLARLYPTHATFVRKWDAATAAEVKQGYLLAADARVLDRVAAQSLVGG